MTQGLDLKPEPELEIDKGRSIKDETLLAFVDTIRPAIDWFTGFGQVTLPKLAYTMEHIFKGDFDKAKHFILTSYWAIDSELTKDPKKRASIEATKPASRTDCLIKAASWGMPLGENNGYFYLIPYSSTLTLDIRWQAYAEILVRTGQIEGRKDFTCWPVYRGDMVRIDRSDPLHDRLEFVQNPFDDKRVDEHFVGCVSTVLFKDGVYRVYTQPREYFDKAKQKSKNLYIYDNGKKTDKLKEDAPWVLWYVRMCEKTMRRYVAGQIATASPELQDMIAYENEAHFEDFEDSALVPTRPAGARAKFEAKRPSWAAASEKAMSEIGKEPEHEQVP